MKNFKQIAFGLLLGALVFGFSAFTRAVKISNTSYIVREYDSLIRNQIFIKYNVDANTRIAERSVSEVYNDAGISTDGILISNTRGEIYYVHYFGVNYFVLDTNLKLKHIVKTLDTFSQYHASITASGASKKNKTFSYSKPRDVINSNATIFGDKLFIKSSLVADNEIRLRFYSNSTIDVYNCLDNLYQGSFYIPKLDGQELTDFKVLNGKIYAAYSNCIIFYTYQSN